MAAEKKVENRLRDGAKKLGGLAIKFVSPSFSGVPDRIVLLPEGRLVFVELKAPGKKPTPVQVSVHKIFAKLGFPVVVLDSTEAVDKFLETYEN